MSVLVANRSRQPQRRELDNFRPSSTIVPSPGDVAALPYLYRTEDALKIAAVVACVGLRAGAFAQLPLKGYQDGRVPVVLSPQPELLAAPSKVRVVVPSVWKTQMSISRDVWGYAAGQIQGVDAAGYVSKVEWVCPDVVTAGQDYVGGPLRWRFNGQEIDASLVFHIPSRWVTPGNPLGMSPLERSGLVDLAKRAQDFGRDWFRNGAVPSAILYADTEIDSTEADGILDKIKHRWRRRQPAVIGSGFRYESVSVPANESQFIETMQQVGADIATSFNLPPEMIAKAVASGGSLTYANREQNVQQYLMQSINPDLVVIQEVIGTYLRPGTYCRWVTGALLRADLKTRYESYKLAAEIQQITGQTFIDVSEMRDLEEMGPLPGGGE